MTQEKFDEWYRQNGVSRERYYRNGFDYVFVTMTDGWIAILQHDPGSDYYQALIQAADRPHAESYCDMRERINVPFNVI